MAVITRAEKGSELSWNELDGNFDDLRKGRSAAVPKAKTAGIKTDSEGTPSYPWHDLPGHLQVYGDAGDAVRMPYQGGIKALQFSLSDSAFVDFHIPHDYVMGSDIFVHAHWSHAGTLVTGGSITLGFEFIYAKGHNQAAFSAPKTESVIQNASTAQYRHMIAETQLSTAGGSATQVDTADLEVDGLIQCRVYLDSNDITVSGGGVPEPYIHAVDIHYQSMSIGTKQRTPDFWT